MGYARVDKFSRRIGRSQTPLMSRDLTVNNQVEWPDGDHSVVRYSSSLEPPSIPSLLRRYKYTILATFSVCLLTAMAVAKLETPIFRSSAVIAFQAPNQNFLNLSGGSDPTTSVGSSESFLPTQIRLLQSKRLARKVVLTTHLNEDPVFFGKSYSLPRRVTKRDSRPMTPHSVDEAAGRLLGAMSIKQEGEAELISLEVSAPDPNLAARLANAVAQEFIDQQQQDRFTLGNATSKWLTAQLEDVRLRLQNSERELQEYAQGTGLLFTSDNSSVSNDRFRKLEEDLSRAHADRMVKEAELHLLQTAPPDTLPKVLDDGALRDYRTRLTDLRRQVAEQSTTLKPEHPTMRSLRAEISVLESALENERAIVLTRIQNEYSGAIQVENLLRRASDQEAKAVTSDAAKSVRYNVLKREVETNRELYGSMMQKVKEYSVLSALRLNDLRLAEAAEPPQKPYRPSLLINGGLGGLCGVVGSVLLVLIRERLNRTVKRRGEVVEALRLPELGVIPSTRSSATTNVIAPTGPEILSANRSSQSLSGLAKPSRLYGGFRRDRLKTSFFTEAFHCTATSILASGRNSCNIFLVTSADPRAGKSTVVANLGAALAHAGQRGVVLDGDLRKPSLHSLFAMGQSPGLTDALKSNAPVKTVLRQVLRKCSVPGLSVLTAGECTAMDWTLLRGSRMSQVLDELRTSHDFVLVDSPPVLQLTDARLLARLVDATVLVFRAGHTRRDRALEAARIILADGCPVCGTILNDWDVKAEDPQHFKDYRSYSTAAG